jgi:hypothetical protein
MVTAETHLGVVSTVIRIQNVQVQTEHCGVDCAFFVVLYVTMLGLSDDSSEM